jgi:hypothetical protein
MESSDDVIASSPDHPECMSAVTVVPMTSFSVRCLLQTVKPEVDAGDVTERCSPLDFLGVLPDQIETATVLSGSETDFSSTVYESSSSGVLPEPRHDTSGTFFYPYTTPSDGPPPNYATMATSGFSTYLSTADFDLQPPRGGGCLNPPRHGASPSGYLDGLVASGFEVGPSPNEPDHPGLPGFSAYLSGRVVEGGAPVLAPNYGYSRGIDGGTNTLGVGFLAGGEDGGVCRGDIGLVPGGTQPLEGCRTRLVEMSGTHPGRLTEPDRSRPHATGVENRGTFCNFRGEKRFFTFCMNLLFFLFNLL